jgi:hypothetical protein
MVLPTKNYFVRRIIRLLYLTDIVRKRIAVIAEQIIPRGGVNLAKTVDVFNKDLPSQPAEHHTSRTSCGISVMPMSLISTGVPY